MFKIVNKQIINREIKRIDIFAEAVARSVRPGQFVMVAVDDQTEQIPLTVVESDEKRGTISLIVHEIGPSSRKLASRSINEEIFLVQGPLGNPATIEKKGLVVTIATGIGTAQILPLCRALKKVGNKILGIIGAKTKSALMLESQMRVVCDEIFMTTRDGTYQRKGLVTDVLKGILEKYQIGSVYATGSVDMMQAVSGMTQPKAIPTFVYVNPFMVCGNGLCGCCRVKVNNEIRLACTEGTEFDGHAVDYDYLRQRMNHLKEMDEWGNLKSQHSPKKSESSIFRKLFWGTPSAKV